MEAHGWMYSMTVKQATAQARRMRARIVRQHGQLPGLGWADRCLEELGCGETCAAMDYAIEAQRCDARWEAFASLVGCVAW